MVTAATGGRGMSLSGGNVAGINPLTGEVLWEYKNWNCIIPAPSAFDAGESRVLIIGGYEAGSAMIKVSKNADGSYSVTELFKNVDFGGHTKPPVMHNGYFYAQYSTNERRDGLVCMSMDGEIMWKTSREPAFDKVIMDIKLEYMNSSSSNQLLMILRNLDENSNINELIINWFYEEDDDDALESGQIYEELLQKASFRYHETI